MNQNTAILIFANSAFEECKQKHFDNGLNLFTSLNTHTLQTVKKTKLPYFVFTEKEQQGTNFAERFTNAIAAVYHQGFSNVITIGNDTPHLQAQHILDAAQKLQENQLVLGPSKDGGFYLMGLPKSQFNKKTFLKLPWQTAQLTKTIVRLIGKNNRSVSFLETLQDIDFITDIQSVLKDKVHYLSAKLQQLLSSIIHKLNNSYHTIISFFQKPFNAASYNKGSPQLLSI